jgi:hypothetical protein
MLVYYCHHVLFVKKRAPLAPEAVLQRRSRSAVPSNQTAADYASVQSTVPRFLPARSLHHRGKQSGEG